MRRRITLSAIRKLEPGGVIWDDRVAGFGARRQKKAVSYIVKTRLNGRQKIITIGRHGAPWTPEEARKEARQILAKVAAGIDPVEEKRRARARQSVDAIWAMFDAEHIDKLKPNTSREYRRLFAQFISPHMGKMALADVTHDDVAALHRKLKDRSRTANLCLAVISKFMNWAEAKGLRPQHSNPVRGIKKYPENRRERFLSEEELRRLADSLQQELEERHNIYVVAAIRLLIFTGARLNEILTLRWEHVDLERGLLLLPDSKTGRKVIVLSAQARAVLEQLPRQRGNPYVICGAKPGRRLVNLQKPWRRIRARSGLEDVRLHDLRHTFASLAARQGGSLPMIGALLGHTQSQTTQRYAHLIADDLRQLADNVGRELGEALLSPGAKPAKESDHAR